MNRGGFHLHAAWPAGNWQTVGLLLAGIGIGLVLTEPEWETRGARPGDASPHLGHWGERGPEFAKWYSLVVRIDATSCGTLIRYDEAGHWLYVASCGHVFTEGDTAVLIEVFYHNDVELPVPRRYSGELLCRRWDHGVSDVSLLRFKADWSRPRVARLAARGFNPDPGRGKEISYHNVGCDGYTSPGHYPVRYLWRERWNKHEQLACEGHPARGGRSGGGLFTEDGVLIGITSRSDYATGRTFYSSASQVYQLMEDCGM